MRTIGWRPTMMIGIFLSIFWMITCYYFLISYKYVEFEKVGQLYDHEGRWRNIQRPIYITGKQDFLKCFTQTREDKQMSNQDIKDMFFISNKADSLTDSMEFGKYDYIILFNRELETLVRAPFLSSQMKKQIWRGKEKSLIPFYGRSGIDSIYVYRVK